MIALHVINTAGGMPAERRFDPASTVLQVKVRGVRVARGAGITRSQERLQLVVGASPSSMELAIVDNNDAVTIQLADETRTLESYGVVSGMALQVSATKLVWLFFNSTLFRYTLRNLTV